MSRIQPDRCTRNIYDVVGMHDGPRFTFPRPILNVPQSSLASWRSSRVPAGSHMAMLARENERLLRSLIAKHRLQQVENAIVEQATECALLIRGQREDYAVVGNSRYGGVPDLPASIPWPHLLDGYLNFLMQINLREIPSICGNTLPKSGMLYFFLASDDDASDVTAKVLFFGGRRTLYSGRRFLHQMKASGTSTLST